MIRRGFWLTAGAVTGIYGYRRASAVGRRLSSRLTRGVPATPGALATPGTPGAPATSGARAIASLRNRRRRSTLLAAVGVARETVRFSRDVREGMELYMARHSAPAGSTLVTDHYHDAQPEDGR
jgi:hypothetical protein